MKRTVFAILMALTCTLVTYADKKEDYQNTYNYKRGVELQEENKDDEALEYFKKEVSDHDDNGYAYAWMASLYFNNDENGDALSAVNLALKNLDKKEYFYSYSLGLRSDIYQDLGDKKKALEDLNNLVKLFPKKAESYAKRAKYYVDEKDFESALKDNVKATELEPGEDVYYGCVGICLRNLNRNDEAIEKYNYALKLNSDNSRTFAQRGYSYFKLGKYQEAADDYTKALDLDNDDMAFSLLPEIADSAFDAIDFKLKIHQMMKPNSPTWLFCRGVIREHVKNYRDAIEYYKKCQTLSYSSTVTRKIGDCLYEMGDFQGALNAIEEGMTVDSTDMWTRMDRAMYLDELGRTDDAIAEYTHVIELAPDFYGGYHKRGWVKDRTNDTDGAIEDYTMSIMVDPDYVYNYLCRGNMYQRKGMNDLAKADFEEVLKRDTVPSQYSAAFYALLALGEKEKAIAALDSTLVKPDKGDYYDAACFYSRMGDKEKALEYMGKSLEMGFCRFNHIDRDDDLDSIRGTEEFKAMIEKYKSNHAETRATGKDDGKAETSGDEVVEKIPFTHEGGVTKIKCKINGLPLHFIFDTGASDVSISNVEANFMLKNDYLSTKDIVGSNRYSTADGSISVGTTIILRKVEIGNLVLENVNASVVRNQKAPLLLGQSVLQRLGKIEIDNAANVLNVTKRK